MIPDLSLSLAPLLPWPLWAVLAGLGLAALAPALALRARGAALRAAFLAFLLLLLAGPVLESERREPLAPVAIVAVDRSPSQEIAPRPAQVEAALAGLEERLARAGVELRLAETRPGDSETRLMEAVAREAWRLEEGRLGAVFLVSDGQVHDMDEAADWGAPVHFLQTGSREEADRSLKLLKAPRFGLLGRPVSAEVLLRAVPEGGGPVPLALKINGREAGRHEAVPGEPLVLSFDLPRRGRNLVEIEAPVLPGEMTAANNRLGLEINGFRDRLRVLLVSGQPHAGQRAWRDLLKSDPAVDLVHFNILREETDDVRASVSELSLIAFPVDQLFLDDIAGFDLVIFDRYFLRGHLREAHLTAVARFVAEGGALLAVAGDEFAGAESLAKSVLGEVLAAVPAAGPGGEAGVARGPFRPARTELGRRHPVTAALPESGARPWGRWYRRAEVRPREAARTLLEDGSAPLLVLARIGQGRSALLASDQIWLWARGHDGGGPQAELLRRLVHWLMGEAELEEERLLLEAASDGSLRVERRSMEEEGPAPVVRLHAPSGEVQELALQAEGGGRAAAVLQGAEEGFWRAEAALPAAPGAAEEALLEDFALVGGGPGLELAEPFSDDALLGPLAAASGGRVVRLEDDPSPRIRRQRSSRPAPAGPLAVVDKAPSRVLGAFSAPLLPPGPSLAAALVLLLALWRRESD